MRPVGLLALLVASVSVSAPPALALQTAASDERIVQWSTAIVVVEPQGEGKSIELTIAQPSTSQTTTAPATAPATQANMPPPKPQIVKGRIDHFKILDSLDGGLQKDQTVDVIRFADAVDGRLPAPDEAGKKLVLLLRRADSALHAPNDAMVLLRRLNGDETSDPALADLRDLIRDVRTASVADTDTIAAQVTALAFAQDATEAEETRRALLHIGPAALAELTLKLADAKLDDAGRGRIAEVIDLLTPPLLPAESQP